MLFKSSGATPGFFKSKHQNVVPITLKNYPYRGNLALDALNAANFEVDDKSYFKIQEVHSKESGQYNITECLRWIMKFKQNFNLTRLRECVLKVKTSHICLTVWGSYIPKFEENFWYEITDMAIKNYYVLSCQLHRQL